MLTDSAIALCNYDIAEKLYSGSRTLVYRALRKADQQPVVIKLLRNEHPTFSELVQFRNQYTIAKNLNSRGIIQSYGVEPYRNGYALVMEDFGGISLGQFALGKPLCLEVFYPIALQISDILDELYRNRIVHKDIKLANILINPDTQQVKLIDFSIASLLPRETPEIQNPNILEGTLAYLSPEQTGRMNRGIDYRSDFYSLGVSFYQLLTGKLPFQSHDPMELVHSHLAKQPPSIHSINPAIPPMLSEIVAKLMAKNAEDRYQSALGLKHDLELCQTQYQQKGNHVRFTLGQCDISDRFLIPERLYGREATVIELLSAFNRVSEGKTELLLVAGFSGIGKTAVVNEVHKPIVRQRGYFIKGKYDQFNRNIPLSAFVLALRDLMGQLLCESDEQLAQWKHRILKALGENGQVAIEVIPELERIVGNQPPVPELSGSAAQNRFNLLFQKFIGVFATQEHPLVMFLDDLQWADSASLSLMQVLMSQSSAGYLLLIGAYRDNEVSPAHPLMLTLGEIQKAEAIVNTLTLAPLNPADVNRLIADTLSCSAEMALPLTELIYQKTQGNPFFTTQFLKALHEDGLISLDFTPPTPPYQATARGGWQCNVSQVRSLSITDDVVEFMAIQLQKLPEATQNVLKLAACIGDRFDLATLAIVSEQSETEAAANLWKALQEGLILPRSEVYKFFQSASSLSGNQSRLETRQQITVSYKFLHDRVQQAAYSLIPDDQKQTTHYQIGQLLLQQISPSAREEHIFEIVNQLNYGTALITQQTVRDELAFLNLSAGKKARLSTAYSAAIAYFTTGIELLSTDCWQSNYELTLALHEATAEVAYLSGEFAQFEAIATITLTSAKTLLDKIATYETQIQAYLAQNRLTEAIQIALKVLSQFGIQLPQNPTRTQTLLGLAKTKLILGRKKPSDLLNLPAMSNPEKLAAMRILFSATSTAFVGAPKLFPLLVFQQINLSVQYGNTPLSACAYASYGIILCGVLIDIDGGYEFGQLALQILERFDMKAIRAKTLMISNCFIFYWKQHYKSTLPGLQEAYQVGAETGDVEYSAWAIALRGTHAFLSGQELSELEQTMHHATEVVKQSKQHIALGLINIDRQVVLNLLGKSPNPGILEGTVYSAAQNVRQEATNNRLGVFYYYVNQTYLSYLFSEELTAVKYAVIAEQYTGGGVSTVLNVQLYFYDSLARLKLYPTTTKTEQSKILRHITQNQKKLQKRAGFAPMNVLHKFYLVEAERYRVLGQSARAQEMYDRSIQLAKENQFLNEEALANEVAAKFYLDWGREKIAQVYMTEAYYCYSRWGAKAKVADLEQRYPQLLQSILQQPKTSLNPLEISTFVTESSLVAYSSTQIASTSISDSLDFASAIKAAQALSSAIELDELLKQLVQIILQNSGGSKCILVLPDRETWQVRAISTPDTTELCSIPLDDHPDVPIKLIQYVKRTQSVVVIDNLQTDLPVIDDYLMQRNPKSILCLPILNQGHLAGILYLKNEMTAGVFTSDRVHILNLLCSQAAISLENARLYQRSQDYAQELEQSLLKLRVSEARFQRLADNLPGVIYQIRIAPDGTISTPYMSSGCVAIYEVPPEELMTGVRYLRSMEHPDDRAGIDQAIQHSAQTMTPFKQELRIVTPSGNVKWLQAASRPELQADGSILWDGVNIDISDRKQAEASLAKEREFLNAIIHNITDGIVVCDASGKLILFNNATREFHGLPVASLPPEQWAEHFDLYQPDGKTLLSQTEVPLFRALQGEIVENAEMIIAPKQGSTRFLLASGQAIFDPLGNKIGAVVAMRDISDRKRMEAASKAFQERLTFVIQQTPLGVIEWNLEFKVVGWNPSAEKIFGYRAEEILDQHAIQIVPEAYRPHVAEVMQGLISGESGQYSLNQNICKDGSLITCEWINTPLRNAQGHPIGIFSIVQDISDRKAAELAIQQKSQALEEALTNLQQAQLQIIQSEKMSALGNLVAGVAHEINNPLGFIAGNLQPALDYVKDTFGLIDLYQQEYPNPSAAIQEEMEAIDIEYVREDLPKLIGSMQLGVDRICSISTSLRTFSRADKDYKVPFNIHEGIDSTILILKHRLKASESRPAIEVETNYGNIPILECFPGQLNQVFMNILANAIDALEEASHQRTFGDIAANRNRIEIQTELDDSGQQAIVYIRDNGMGMSEEVKQRVFDHLFTTKAVGKGTGLGLAIARQIVEKHGGTIDVNSELGQGTEFAIALPIEVIK